MSQGLTLMAQKVSVYNSSGFVEVELEGIPKGDVLDQFTLREILDHFDWSQILDAIGIDKCKEHFDLVEDKSDK